MKRASCFVLALLCLLSACVFALPASAAQDDFAGLTYTLDPLTEGGATESGRVTPDQRFSRTPTITYDADLTVLEVNGVVCAGGSCRLEYAGEYKLTVSSKRDPAADPYTYKVVVMPDVNIKAQQVFTSYPTLTCSNAVEMVLDAGLMGQTEKKIESGYVVSEIGRHTLTVYGYTAEGKRMQFQRYDFYVRAVDVKRVFDTASGKQALQLTLGSYPDHTITATLDGKELAQGANIVTGVGAHDLLVTLDGESVMKDNGFSVPSAEELTLRVQLELASLDTDEPFYIYLDEWDADFRLDGKPVSGDIRITADGRHTLGIMGPGGTWLRDMFDVKLDTEQESVRMDQVTFTFENPHLTYVYFLIVPAALLVIVAVVFVIKRRTIL